MDRVCVPVLLAVPAFLGHCLGGAPRLFGRRIQTVAVRSGSDPLHGFANSIVFAVAGAGHLDAFFHRHLFVWIDQRTSGVGNGDRVKWIYDRALCAIVSRDGSGASPSRDVWKLFVFAGGDVKLVAEQNPDCIEWIEDERNYDEQDGTKTHASA